ncbi:hypothetical protein Pmani_011988 [Petrolisthes manimaculis]|uniref:Uncharacterized protein n=1 Tax=Petrolisthes manimaculis TaxID=1843537 RepID=A0AAE1PYY8_9EUCA|nr:hypothetical protein Pmani_011988 [Petrolisthes manimaculis]
MSDEVEFYWVGWWVGFYWAGGLGWVLLGWWVGLASTGLVGGLGWVLLSWWVGLGSTGLVVGGLAGKAGCGLTGYTASGRGNTGEKFLSCQTLKVT